MLWLVLALIVATLYAVNSILDNYIADVVFKDKIPQAIKCFNGPFYLVAALIIFLCFDIQSIGVESAMWLIGSGILCSLSSIPYYLALRSEEATSAVIFYQLQPIFYLIAGIFLFGEQINFPQICGFILILIAPAIVVFSRKRPRSRRVEMSATLYFIAYVAINSASGIISTHIGSGIDFPTMFFYFILGRAIIDIFMVAMQPRWRQRFKYIWRRQGMKAIGIISLEQLIHIVTELTYRAALIIGIAAITSVVTNVAELVMTFILGIVFTIIWPKFGREKLTRHVVIAHLLATIVAIIGIIILQ